MTEAPSSQPRTTEQNAPAGEAPLEGSPGGDENALISELLVEEVSIDGMCGVY